MAEISLPAAFIAGFLLFFLPCTYPLVPVYIGMVTGTSVSGIKDKDQLQAAGRKFIVNGILFVIGFSLVFAILGSIAGWLSNTLGADYREQLTRLSGLLIAVFGMTLLLVQFGPAIKERFHIKLPLVERLQHSWKLQFPSKLKPGGKLTSFAVGFVFAFGWSPCLGPVLGSILTLAASSGGWFQGAVLLIVFSLGLAIPFLAISVSLAMGVRVLDRMKRISKYINYLTFITAVFLITIGILILSGAYSQFMADLNANLLRDVDFEGILERL